MTLALSDGSHYANCYGMFLEYLMSKTPSFRVLAAMLLAGLVGPTHAAHLLQRGVLVARETGQVIFMSPDSAIENVSIGSGKTTWISPAGAMPIALDSGRLLALREGAERGKLACALIDAADGKLVSRTDAEIAETARGLVDDLLDERFELLAAADGLRWSHQREPVPGAHMADEVTGEGSKRGAATRVSGAFAIDWSAGSLAPVAESSLKSAEALPAEVGPPSTTGPRTFRSVDDAFRLSSERMDDGRYRWVLSEANGKRLGETINESSYRPFDVVDGRLLYVTTAKVSMVAGKAAVDMPTLVAIDLRTGQIAWTREIRDTHYRGPFPS